ncbi:uncharacterized protein BDZ99DRAFT_520550 [Mytilinidion resinicola]|uniref:Homeodomain-like protein n=1 Tax=Mytilinidion resinicola TaxID=574789 RepID=A0A6A6YNX5_9PEZI|nr:uncharacterized protein BDZ99DRAFT_520550 [Mytilinidion resinicola]KAF2810480.1 hypothetical protein BDZ99DRAFT_520550 [Mytilinidion resinicola]
MPETRRKQYQYKVHKASVRKTDKKELTPIQRAFIAGACLKGNASHNSIATFIGVNHRTITRLLQRVETRAQAANIPLHDELLYKTELGRGRKTLLNKEEKENIQQIIT